MPEERIQTSEKETEEVKPETEIKPEEHVEKAPEIDYEKKFSESSRENQILRERLAAEERARQELTKEPTDSELRTAFPSWDLYDDTQKELARRTYGSERTALNASRIAQELQAERSQATTLEVTIASNPSLQGKEQAFKDYASKPQYKNVPMDVLVDAFLGKQSGAPEPKPTPKPGLEPGNGGPRTTDKPQQLSADQLKALRTSDEKAYLEYVKTHDVDVDNL